MLLWGQNWPQEPLPRLITIKSQTDRQTESNAYEPTVHTHRWAQKSIPRTNKVFSLQNCTELSRWSRWGGGKKCMDLAEMPYKYPDRTVLEIKKKKKNSQIFVHKLMQSYRYRTCVVVFFFELNVSHVKNTSPDTEHIHLFSFVNTYK